MQQGAYVAKLIRRRLAGKDTEPFRFKDRGSMAVIGRAAAVAHVGKLKFHGYFAWLVWLFIHLINLVEYENRLLVIIQWGWNYFTRKRSARLITFEQIDISSKRRESGKNSARVADERMNSRTLEAEEARRHWPALEHNTRPES